jgi:hypothetical protein
VLLAASRRLLLLWRRRYRPHLYGTPKEGTERHRYEPARIQPAVMRRGFDRGHRQDGRCTAANSGHERQATVDAGETGRNRDADLSGHDSARSHRSAAGIWLSPGRQRGACRQDERRGEKRHWHSHPAVQDLRGLCRSCRHPVCRRRQRWHCGAHDGQRNPRFSGAAWKDRQARDERLHRIHGSRRGRPSARLQSDVALVGA